MLLSRKRLYRIKKTKEQSRRRRKHRNKKKYRRRKKGKSRGKRKPLNLRKRTMKSYRGGFNGETPSILMAYESTHVDDEYLNFILITLKPQGDQTKQYADRLKDLVCVGEDVVGDQKRDQLIKDIHDNIKKVNLNTNTLEYLQSPILEYRFVTQVPLKPGAEEWIHNFNCNLSLPRQGIAGTYRNPNDLIEDIKAQMAATSSATKQHHDDDDAGAADEPHGNESKRGSTEPNLPTGVAAMTTREIIAQLKKLGEQCASHSDCKSNFCKRTNSTDEYGVCTDQAANHFGRLPLKDKLKKFTPIIELLFNWFLDKASVLNMGTATTLSVLMNSVPFLNSSLDKYNGQKNPGIILMNITRINIAMEIIYRLIWLKNDIPNEVLTKEEKLDYVIKWWRLLNQTEIVVTETATGVEKYREELMDYRDNSRGSFTPQPGESLGDVSQGMRAYIQNEIGYANSKLPVDPKPVIDDAKRSIQIEGLPSLEIGYFLSETTRPRDGTIDGQYILKRQVFKHTSVASPEGEKYSVKLEIKLKQLKRIAKDNSVWHFPKPQDVPSSDDDYSVVVRLPKSMKVEDETRQLMDSDPLTPSGNDDSGSKTDIVPAVTSSCCCSCCCSCKLLLLLLLLLPQKLVKILLQQLLLPMLLIVIEVVIVKIMLKISCVFHQNLVRVKVHVLPKML